MKGRIDFIDGLRAVAVLSVVAFHAAGINAGVLPSTAAPILAVLRQGCHGVDLFFVISGFCLSYPVLARVHGRDLTPFDFTAFISRRVIRIVPPYFVAIAALLALALFVRAVHLPTPAGMPQHGLTVADVIRQAFFFDADVHLLNSAFWTLAVEFRWYLLFPIALWLWLRSPKAFGLAALAAAIASTATRAGSVDLAVLPTFMLGIVAADLHLRSFRWVPRIAIPALLLALVAAFLTSKSPAYLWSANSFWAIASFWFVVAAGVIPALRSLMSLKFLTAIGVTSYGIYLVHEPAGSFIADTLGPHTAGWILFTVMAIAGIVAGMLFSLAAERPFVSTPLRARLVSELYPALSNIFKRCGISGRIDLPPPAEEPPAVRAVA
jgi:peptidoglycan/LPS O-acetylase OafA/YrhL